MALVQSLRIPARGCGTLAALAARHQPPASPPWKAVLIFFLYFLLVPVKLVWFISFHFGHFSLGVFHFSFLGVFVAMTL